MELDFWGFKSGGGFKDLEIKGVPFYIFDESVSKLFRLQRAFNKHLVIIVVNKFCNW